MRAAPRTACGCAVHPAIQEVSEEQSASDREKRHRFPELAKARIGKNDGKQDQLDRDEQPCELSGNDTADDVCGQRDECRYRRGHEEQLGADEQPVESAHSGHSSDCVCSGRACSACTSSEPRGSTSVTIELGAADTPETTTASRPWS